MDTHNSSFIVHFSRIEDPRLDRKKLHSVYDIVVVTICAVIAGAALIAGSGQPGFHLEDETGYVAVIQEFIPLAEQGVV